MDNQDKYEELENIITSLDMLIAEIIDKTYKNQLEDIKREAENELNEVRLELSKQKKKETEERFREFKESRL